MRRLTGVVALILVTVWVTFSEGRANGRLTDADDAWDRGDYPRALNAYLALLDRTPTDDETEAIALQTGELFKTVELTADGGAPRFSPDAGRGQVGVGSGSGRGQVGVRSGSGRTGAVGFSQVRVFPGVSGEIAGWTL